MKYIQAARRDWPGHWNEFLHPEVPTTRVGCEFDHENLTLKITCSDPDTLRYLIRPFSGCRKTTAGETTLVCFPTRAAFDRAGNYFLNIAYERNGLVISEEEID